MATLLFVLAACLFGSAQAVLARANPGVHVPGWRSPPRDPWLAKVLRVLALLSAAVGTTMLYDGIRWWWPALITLGALLLPGEGIRRLYNRRLSTQPAA